MVIKDIEGFEGLYMIREDGKVFNSKGQEKKPILVTAGNKKYKSYRISLWRNNKEFRASLHRLIAKAFLPNPDNKPFINHKDENPLNNNLDNLEWCEHQYNIEYTLSKHYELLSPSGERIKVFNLMKFCRENDLTAPTMYAVAAGRNKSHKGWKLYGSGEQSVY